MITVIHLSDLHIHESNAEPDNRNAKVTVKYLCDRFKDAPKDKTYVVLTGDNVDDGSSKQYLQLKANVLEPLSKTFTLLVAPGNHDYAYMGWHSDEKETPERFRNCIRSYVNSVEYPSVVANHKEKALFVGLDSGDPLNMEFIAEGVVGDEQRKALAKCLGDPQYDGYFKAVYLHHHPFLRSIGMALHDSEELLRVISGSVNLVLFGHKHVTEAFFQRYRVPVMLASGKVTEPAGNALAFRVAQIEPGKHFLVHMEEIQAA
jgi:3',5'-cyclic AMP phosphodiesterase CpdA